MYRIAFVNEIGGMCHVPCVIHVLMIYSQSEHKKKGHDKLLNMPLEDFGHKMVTPFRISSPTTYHNSLYNNMGDTGFEPATS